MIFFNNTQFKSIVAILTLTLVLSSCSSEDDSQLNPLTNNTIEINFNENPRSGDLITTITTSLIGDISFTLSSESISNAFTLDSNSGELRVAAWQVFDFETTEIITATVSISNGTQTENKVVIVNLNNIDDIWSYLNDSRSAYENASIGQWIMVTESEYNDLANYLFDVTTCGTTNSQYNRNDPISYDSSFYTYSNNNGVEVQSENYVFAFKYITNANNLSNTKVKISANLEDGYQAIGNVPTHNSGENYFVLKGASVMHMEPTYLAVGSNGLGYFNGTSGYSFKYGEFDVNELPYNWTGIALYQGLSTPVKQW